MRRCGWVLMLLLAGAGAQARMDTGLFPYQKALALPDDPPCAVAAFDLDDELYAATDAPYANLRMLDALGAEVPYTLRRKTHTVTQTVETAVFSRILGLETKDEQRIGLQVELRPADGVPEVLVIQTRNRNFEKMVTVYGSDTLSDWNLLVEDARIFDYSRFIEVRDTRIELPRRGYKYLRIDLSNLTERRTESDVEITLEKRGEATFSEIERRVLRNETIHIDGVELYARKSVLRDDEPFRQAYSISGLAFGTDEKRQATIWTFETARQPLVSLSFDVAHPNFSRRFVVEGRREGAASAWDGLGDAILYRLNLGVLQDSRLTLPLRGECRYGQYRVTVYDQDNAPLQISGLTATGAVYEARFLPSSPAPYVVLYGGEKVTAPRYDVEALLKVAPGLSPCLGRLGPQAANPLFQPVRVMGKRPGKLLFGAALAAAVVLLGWLIVQGAKKIEKV